MARIIHRRPLRLLIGAAWGALLLLVAAGGAYAQTPALPAPDGGANPQLSSFIGLAGAPIVAALVSVAVKPWLKNASYWPLAALVLGMAWNVGISLAIHTDGVTAVFVGILTGLAASGAFSAAKTLGLVGGSDAGPSPAAGSAGGAA